MKHYINIFAHLRPSQPTPPPSPTCSSYRTVTANDVAFATNRSRRIQSSHSLNDIIPQSNLLNKPQHPEPLKHITQSNATYNTCTIRRARCPFLLHPFNARFFICTSHRQNFIALELFASWNVTDITTQSIRLQLKQIIIVISVVSCNSNG